MTDKDKLSREDLRADRAAPPRRASTVTGTYSRTGPDTRQTVSPSSPGRMADSGTE